nr:immunoglobulin heavy chain junction region [Mus musculus]MBK4185710.1 immunoglobulin heavy chain junction region [Mus musculus]
SVRDGYYMGTS